MKLGTHVYLVYIIVVKWLELKIIVICLILHANLRFQGFLSIFGTFPHEVAQTCFVLNEISDKRLFGIYYCVEMVRTKNHSQMLEVTCYVAILSVFKRCWHFRT